VAANRGGPGASPDCPATPPKSGTSEPRRTVKQQRTILGIVLREVDRKLNLTSPESQNTLARLKTLLERAERIRTQQPKDKNKRYALHAPELECIGKGKARKPYEFGLEASIAVTHKRGLIVGTRTFPGNPYDGHMLHQQLELTGLPLAGTGKVPKQVVVDLGYRGVEIISLGKYKSLTKQQRRWLKRRQGVEPAIGHGEGAGSAVVSARKGLEPAGKDLRR
jgi:IS5 family transposase